MTVIEDVYKIRSVPKQRPRFRRGSNKPYTPTKTEKYEKRLEALMRKTVGKFPTFWRNEPLHIKIVFFFKRPKKPSHEYPMRGDLDNHIKSFLDAANEILYGDDGQIIKISAMKQFDKEDQIIFSIGHADILKENYRVAKMPAKSDKT